MVILLFTPPEQAKAVEAPLKEKLLQLDFLGLALVMGLITSCMLALQYGGQTHAWGSSEVIGLLVGFVAMSVTFVLWEIYQKERAMIVGRLVGSSRAGQMETDQV